jgi:hypothetical protein
MMSDGRIGAPAAWLVFNDGGTRRAVPLRCPGVVVGRDPASCDVSVKDFGISRVHGRIEVGPTGTMVLTDLESKGGSFVNERAVVTAELKIGDQLRLGHFLLAIAAEPPADATREEAPDTYAGKEMPAREPWDLERFIALVNQVAEVHKEWPFERTADRVKTAQKLYEGGRHQRLEEFASVWFELERR